MNNELLPDTPFDELVSLDDFEVTPLINTPGDGAQLPVVPMLERLAVKSELTSPVIEQKKSEGADCVFKSHDESCWEECKQTENTCEGQRSCQGGECSHDKALLLARGVKLEALKIKSQLTNPYKKLIVAESRDKRSCLADTCTCPDTWWNTCPHGCQPPDEPPEPPKSVEICP